MMETELRARLASVVAAGVPVDWEENDQSAAGLRVVLRRISGGPDYAYDGATGLARARVQVDCYAERYGAALTLATELRIALSGWRGGAISAVFVDAQRDLGKGAALGRGQSGVAVDVFVHYQE